VLKAEDDPRENSEIVSTIARKHPIELEECIDTPTDPVIIECASPGWQPDVWPPEEAYPEGDLPPNYTEPGDTRYSATLFDRGPGTDVDRRNLCGDPRPGATPMTVWGPTTWTP